MSKSLRWLTGALLVLCSVYVLALLFKVDIRYFTFSRKACENKITLEREVDKPRVSIDESNSEIVNEFLTKSINKYQETTNKIVERDCQKPTLFKQ